MPETIFVYTLFSAPRQVVQKVDNAIIWINLCSVDNIIGFPNTYCWIVIYAMVSAIQHLNNWVQGITVVSRETEDSVCLCKRRQTRWWLFQDWNYYWEFLVCVCLPGFQILTLFKIKKMPFFTPVFRSGLWEIMSSLPVWLLRLERGQKKSIKIHFEFVHFSFFLIDFSGIETINTFTHFPVASTKTMKFKIPANQALV